jgi:hypothetical protein
MTTAGQRFFPRSMVRIEGTSYALHTHMPPPPPQITIFCGSYKITCRMKPQTHIAIWMLLQQITTGRQVICWAKDKESTFLSIYIECLLQVPQLHVRLSYKGNTTKTCNSEHFMQNSRVGMMWNLQSSMLFWKFLVSQMLHFFHLHITSCPVL